VHCDNEIVASHSSRTSPFCINFKLHLTCCQLLLLLTAHGRASDQLMQAMLPLIDRDVCNQPAWHNNTVDDSMICAGYERGQLGNCYVSVTIILADNSNNVYFPHFVFMTGSPAVKQHRRLRYRLPPSSPRHQSPLEVANHKISGFPYITITT